MNNEYDEGQFADDEYNGQYDDGYNDEYDDYDDYEEDDDDNSSSGGGKHGGSGKIFIIVLFHILTSFLQMGDRSWYRILFLLDILCHIPCSI